MAMDLLKKTKRPDTEAGIQKPPVFGKGNYLKSAQEYRAMWGCIADSNLLHNLGYRMQYLDYQIRLYNTYDITLASGSLHIQNIRVTIAGIIDSVLYRMVEDACNSAGYNFDRNREFSLLIEDAHELEIIDDSLKQELQSLRTDANKGRFATFEYRELDAYKREDANHAIETFNRFIEYTQPEPKSPVAEVIPVA